MKRVRVEVGDYLGGYCNYLVKDNGSSGWCGGRIGGEKWLFFGCILNVELIGFFDGLGI